MNFHRHCVFAELFCEAIKNGLPALQTQHPGIYFHKAAEYIQRRKEAFLQCNGKLTKVPFLRASSSWFSPHRPFNSYRNGKQLQWSKQ